VRCEDALMIYVSGKPLPTTTHHRPPNAAPPRIAADAARPSRTTARFHASALDIEPAPIERRKGTIFLRQPDDLDRLDQPTDTLMFGVAGGCSRSSAMCRRKRYPPPLGGYSVRRRFASILSLGLPRPTLPRLPVFPASKSLAIQRFVLCRRQAFRRASCPRPRRRSDATDSG